ncbi:hypothetical protein AB0I94_14865 [Streptomyces sp. NPDC050147]|uniref:hypothetical protein n=1 Tax=Streptomyces sp. NPDC050147 TaxID=3155513 RepID=UPI0034397C05
MDDTSESAAESAGTAEPADAAGTGETAETGETAAGPFAECVLCREPTEYPETHKGVTLCPVCEWHEAQRSACSG